MISNVFLCGLLAWEVMAAGDQSASAAQAGSVSGSKQIG